MEEGVVGKIIHHLEMSHCHAREISVLLNEYFEDEEIKTRAEELTGKIEELTANLLEITVEIDFTGGGPEELDFNV